MKNLILIIMALFTFNTTNAQESIYDIKINDISGNPIDLKQFRGKYILFVNVASECGFTPQYAGLEELHQQFKENLVLQKQRSLKPIHLVCVFESIKTILCECFHLYSL